MNSKLLQKFRLILNQNDSRFVFVNLVLKLNSYITFVRKSRKMTESSACLNSV